jgi:hypothetical protein
MVPASEKPEIEKPIKTRDNALYEYANHYFLTYHSTYFKQYSLERLQNK